MFLIGGHARLAAHPHEVHVHEAVGSHAEVVRRKNVGEVPEKLWRETTNAEFPNECPSDGHLQALAVKHAPSDHEPTTPIWLARTLAKKEFLGAFPTHHDDLDGRSRHTRENPTKLFRRKPNSSVFQQTLLSLQKQDAK